MTRELPAESGTGCMLCIDAARVPILGGLLGQLESPAAWSEADYAAGYQWAALLQEELIMGCSLGQQLDDIGVILAHASGLTDALTTERLEQLLPAVGGRLEQIENSGIDPTNELANGTRRWASAQDIADLRGLVPDGWLGFATRAPTLADIYTALSTAEATDGIDEAVSVWDTVIDAIDAGGDISNIVDMIRGVGDTVADGTLGTVQALGQYLTALALGVISWQMNMDAIQRAGIENNTRDTAQKLDEILLALRGAAQPPQNIQEAIEAIDTTGNQEAVLNELLLAVRGPLPQADNLLAILRGGQAVTADRNVMAALVGDQDINETYNIAVLIREQLNPYSLNASFNLYGIASILSELKQKLLNEPTAGQPDLIETNLYDLLLALQSGADDSTAQHLASIANSNLTIDKKIAALVKCACDGYTEPEQPPNITECDTYTTWESSAYYGAQQGTGRCPLRLDQPTNGVQHWESVSADGLTATQDLYGWTVDYEGVSGWFLILDIPAWDSQYMQYGEEDPIYPEPGTGLINRHTTHVNICHQHCEGTVTICPPSGGTNPPAPVCITGRTLIPEGETLMYVIWDQPHPADFQIGGNGTSLIMSTRGAKLPIGTTIEIIGEYPSDVVLLGRVGTISSDDYTVETGDSQTTITLTAEQSLLAIRRAVGPYDTVPFWAKVCIPGVVNPFD
jgi:hypothetical protein